MANITSFNSIGGFGVGDNNTLVIDSNANIIGNTVRTGNIVPSADNTYFLGNADNRWANIWLGPGTIYMTDIANTANTAQLTVSNGILQVNGAAGLQANLVSGNTSLTMSNSGPILMAVGGNANVLAVNSSNVEVTGDITASGNATATYFKGNGSLLTGIGGTFAQYVCANTVSAVNPSYYQLQALGSFTPQALATVPTTVSTTATLLASFVTNTGYPATTAIPVGYVQGHFDTSKASGNRVYYIYFTLSKRTAAGVETLLATSSNSELTADNATIHHQIEAMITTPITLSTTDLLVIKVYAVVDSGTATINLLFDDNTDTGVIFPVVTPDTAVFVPYVNATANIDLNSKSLTSNANITANKFIGNGALLTNINASNINGQVANALVAGTVYTADQPSITSVGILTSLTVSGAITAASVGSTGNVSGGNLRTGGVVSAAGNVIAANFNASGVLSSTGNVTGGNIRTVGLISATGNITGNVFVGNGAALTSVIPSEQINWNTWMNGSNLANCTASGTPLTTYGYAGYAVYSGISNYGYELTNNTGGTSGGLFWSIPNINWSSNNPITFKASVSATSPTQTGAGAGDGPTIYVGGSTYATTTGIANAGLGVTVCYYTGSPRVQLYNGSTLLATFTSTGPEFTLNSSTLYQVGTTSLSTNWYDLELVLKKFGSKRIAEVKINGSMVAQYDVTSWSPVGSYVSVAAQCGAAYSYQFCRAFSASW